MGNSQLLIPGLVQLQYMHSLDEIVFYHHKIIKETCGNVASFHVSAYFTVHRPYFRMIPLDVFVQWNCTVLNKQATGRSTNPLPFAGFTHTRKGCPENSQHAAYKQCFWSGSCLLPLCQVSMVTIVHLKMCTNIWSHTFCDLHSPAVLNAPEAC